MPVTVTERTRPAPHATHHHIPAAISLNVFSLRRDLGAMEGFNAKVALLLTRVIGTMWCFWVFNGIALVSLPSAIGQHSLTVLINWISSNWIQLILLPALMVGQNLQAVASDARANRQFADTELIVDRLDTRTEGGIADVLAAVHASITLTGHVLDVVAPGHAETVPAEVGEIKDEGGTA
jgi:hypothetical protein